MLNMISYTENAAQPRPRFGMGACLPALVPAATPAGKRAVAIARPRTERAVGFAGQHPVLAAAGQATGTQLGSEQPAYTTLISATGDGALGPHPAREPV